MTAFGLPCHARWFVQEKKEKKKKAAAEEPAEEEAPAPKAKVGRMHCRKAHMPVLYTYCICLYKAKVERTRCATLTYCACSCTCTAPCPGKPRVSGQWILSWTLNGGLPRR